MNKYLLLAVQALPLLITLGMLAIFWLLGAGQCITFETLQTYYPSGKAWEIY
ncbi:MULTISPECIES: hypothetical protein [Legionella]|uniref:hypothetical protein n=1 Tax=Legionella TaxID=445 RepID=UPI0013156C1B|nr:MULTISPECIES: hypothetical protein [Legionella]MCP0913991.1 hypothetical protein [Legionella sp. 27cVA30]